MALTIKPFIFATIIPPADLQSPITLKLTIFATATSAYGNDLNSPVVLKPAMFATTTTANGNDLSSPIKLSPKIFAIVIAEETADLQSPITVKPAVFATVVSSKEPPTPEKVRADTLLITTNIFNQVRADTLCRIVEKARADTLLFVSNISRARADAVKRRPLVLKYVVENSPVTFSAKKLNAPVLRNSQPSIVNSFKDFGITSISATLTERTLSDKWTIETASNIPVDINDLIHFQLLDYDFKILVEEINERDGLRSIVGMYDCDKLLYTQIYTDKILTRSHQTTTTSRNFSSSTSAEKHSAGHSSYATKIIEQTTYIWKASKYIGTIANHYGFNINILFDDFAPSQSLTDSNVTYRDIINQLFSWTSRLPQRQINVFIRGDTLHCIQRGKETSTFDISNLPHSRPQISKKLLRSLWNNPDNASVTQSTTSSGTGGTGGNTIINYPDDKRDPILDYTEDEEEYSVPFSGVISYTAGDTQLSMRYVAGLLANENTRLQNSTTTTNNTTDYGYATYGGDEYLLSKHTTNKTERTTEDDTWERITQTVKVDNTYFFQGNDGIYLGAEQEVNETKKEEYTKDRTKLIDSETTVSHRNTYHFPVGNGWYAQVVYVDGELQGGNLSQGKPGQKISKYTITHTRKVLNPVEPTPATNGGDSGGTGGTGGGDSGGDTGDEDFDKYSDDSDWRDRLSPIVDTSFPVAEISLLYELTDALRWLNRKIQEEITVDLISKFENGVPSINHVIDFTERVILDGNEYFLISNQISFTPRKFIQKLQLVRWYAQ